MNILFGGIQNLFGCVKTCLHVLAGPSLSASILLAFGFAAVAALWFLSGMAAANIAETRGYNPRLHLILGLILPGIYPSLLRGHLRPLEGSILALEQTRTAAKAAAEERRAVQETAKKQQEEQQFQREEEDPSLWTAKKLSRMMTRPDGTPAGPFLCTLTDGQTVRILRFQAALPEVAAAELPPPEGKTDPMVIRLPYSKIQSLEEEI